VNVNVDVYVDEWFMDVDVDMYVDADVYVDVCWWGC